MNQMNQMKFGTNPDDESKDFVLSLDDDSQNITYPSLNFQEGASTEAPSSIDGDDIPPWDDSDEEDEDEEEEEEEELEIYKKAANFNKLHLLSGNTIGADKLPDYIAEHYGKLGSQRYKLAKFVMTNLGYQPSPDCLLMLSSTKRARAVIATAGAGKTTSLQFDLMISKMIDKALGKNELAPEEIGDTGVFCPRILYLNYNKHNVQPILDRHVAMCASVSQLLKPEDKIDNSIESSTVHAFCHKWLSAFSHKEELKLPELKIIDDVSKEKIWSAIIPSRIKKFYNSDDVHIEWETLDELYNYKVESMLDWDSFYTCAKFVDAGLDQKFAKSCITKYDAMKKNMKLMDFTDYLIMLTEVLREHADLRRMLQERYRIIIADENQDFTRLMNELLIQLYDPKVNRLVVVGDPDQTIYAFKGVSPDNIVTLYDSLEDCDLLGLDTNYRCPDKIVDAAKAILDLNVLRFKKPIGTIRTGGTIMTHPIKQGVNQEDEVLKRIKHLSPTQYKDAVITYRNNQSSIIIAEELYYAGIPFQILDDRRPFNNPVFKHITGALSALKEKDNLLKNKTLFHFLPVNKEEWNMILNSNAEQRRHHIEDLVLPNTRRDLDKAMTVLLTVSRSMDKVPVCDYIDVLLSLYHRYFFDFMVSRSTPISEQDQELYKLYLKRADKFFRRQMTYDYMMKEFRERNVDNSNGVTLSTFHGLKGLEFDYVYAIDFRESIFPNFYGIEQAYSENTAREEKESENRLCYVLVTRTKKEFHMFYPDTDPSSYVSILTNCDVTTHDVAGSDGIVLGDVTGADDSNQSVLNFVKRLVGNRG